MNLTRNMKDNRQSAALTPLQAKAVRVGVVVVALVVAILGWMQAAQMLISPVLVAGLGETVQSGDLALRVPVAEWVQANHGHDPAAEPDEAALGPVPDPAAPETGYAMPAAMMPGMPVEGQQRLRVEVALANHGGTVQTVGPEDFRVEAADGTVFLPLLTNSFRSSSLGVQEGLEGVLFVDVDQKAENVTLVWQRGGAQARIPIGGAPAHTEPH